MKVKYMVIITCMVIVIAVIFGIRQRYTYTDITAKEGFKEHLKVAQLSEDLIDLVIENMEKNLSNSSYILKVKAKGITEYLYRVSQEKVQVVDVYKGSDIQVGDEIYITNGSGHYVPSENSIELSFVNEMEKGEEYLVFIEKKIDSLYSNTDNVYMLSNFIMKAIFGYKDRESVVSAMHYDDSTYVDYKDVKNNEFFVETEEGMKKIMDFKYSLLKQYP